MEDAVGPLSTDEVRRIVHHAKVPFWHTIGKVTHVDPKVSLPVGDDIADVQIAVQAGRRGGYGVSWICLAWLAEFPQS